MVKRHCYNPAGEVDTREEARMADTTYPRNLNASTSADRNCHGEADHAAPPDITLEFDVGRGEVGQVEK